MKPMLTKEEERFIEYWHHRRLQKGIGFTAGWPVGIIVILALFLNIVTGWHKKALMVLRANTSVVLSVIFAALAIVVFFTIFSSRYQREQKEQRYQELLAKKKAWEAEQISAH
jgi:hypothetical protein